MQAQGNKFLVLLALLTGAVLAAAPIERRIWISSQSDESPEDYVWKNKFLRNWDNGWDVNIDGEPLDPNTACFGRPCNKFKLKPSFGRRYEFCKTSTGIEYICNNVPENAIFVEDYDDDNDYNKDDFPDDGETSDFIREIVGC
ncbi:hypothetical protein BGZ46_009600 [Entomortierella lignicola]|nr:hypothetical protein BGZ46_009600 [Entomortierella lignicola]